MKKLLLFLLIAVTFSSCMYYPYGYRGGYHGGGSFRSYGGYHGGGSFRGYGGYRRH